jgi:hypothetical protein
MMHAGMHHTCPWCSDGNIGMLIPLFAIMLTQTALIIFLWRRFRAHIFTQLLAGLIGFLVAGYLEAILHGWVKNYPG